MKELRDEITKMTSWLRDNACTDHNLREYIRILKRTTEIKKLLENY